MTWEQVAQVVFSIQAFACLSVVVWGGAVIWKQGRACKK